MKRQLAWQRVPREALAQHLREVDILESEAIGEVNVYRCRDKQGESMAISLPGDTGLIINVKQALPPTLERRRRTPANKGETP